MGLVKCSDCRSEVSTAAKACPKCGAPPPKPPISSPVKGCMGLLGLAIAAVVGLAVLFPAIEAWRTMDETPEQRAARDAARRRDSERKVAETKEREEKVERLVQTLIDNSIVVRIDHARGEVQVDGATWNASPLDTKRSMTRLLSEYCEAHGGSAFVDIVDSHSGRTLASVGLGGVSVH